MAFGLAFRYASKRGLEAVEGARDFEDPKKRSNMPCLGREVERRRHCMHVIEDEGDGTEERRTPVDYKHA